MEFRWVCRSSAREVVGLLKKFTAMYAEIRNYKIQVVITTYGLYVELKYTNDIYFFKYDKNKLPHFNITPSNLIYNSNNNNFNSDKNIFKKI